MASKERQNLPNLKICVDNTEEGELYDSSGSEEAECAIEIDEETKTIDDEVAGEVEFSVRISDLEGETKPKQELTKKSSVYAKMYENRDGDFVTGMDLSSKEAAEKREERAKRFGIESKDKLAIEEDVRALYASLGLKEDDFHRGERGVRPEAIHVRGTDDMSTQDVFAYFKEFAPGGVEWIDDASCNVVWADQATAARAMMKLSRSYKVVMETETKEEKEEQKTMKSEEMKSGGKEGRRKEMKEGTKDENMEVEEYDDNLDLLEETRKERREKDKLGSPSRSDEDNEDKGKMDMEEQEDLGKRIQKNSKRSQHKSQINWPPGKWRLGHPNSKAKFIFMRFATRADKKLPRAEGRSKYYQKYGNPNYGGMKGLISNSRREWFRVKTYEEELAETMAAIESNRAAREADERGDKEQLPRISPLKRKRRASAGGSDDEGLDMEAELQQLLEPPPRKQRSMRMYADDEEEELKSKRYGGTSGVLTVVAGATDRLPKGKVKDARELIRRGTLRSKLMSKEQSVQALPPRRDLRLRIRASPSVSESDGEAEEESDSDGSASEEDSVPGGGHRPSNVLSRLGPSGDSSSGDSDNDLRGRIGMHSSVGRVKSDLRSRLGDKGPRDKRKYPPMRIEVFD